MWPDIGRVDESMCIVDSGLEGEGRYRPHPWHAHQASADGVLLDDGQQPGVQLVEAGDQLRAHRQHRGDQVGQEVIAVNQLCDPSGEAAGRHLAELEPEGHQGAAQLVLEVRSEEHTSELQSLMCISYAVFCLKKKKLNK